MRIGNDTQIGDNSILVTQKNINLGIPSSIMIGNHVTIGHQCTINSCIIDDYVEVGFKSIICEGAVLMRGAKIGSNSVVPAGIVIGE